MGSGRPMAEGGGRPRCGVDILLFSSVALTLTRSELTGISTFGWGDSRGWGSGSLGAKSWMLLPPGKSALVGCERVSNIEDEALGGGEACDRVLCKQCSSVQGARQRYKEDRQYIHTFEQACRSQGNASRFSRVANPFRATPFDLLSYCGTREPVYRR